MRNKYIIILISILLGYSVVGCKDENRLGGASDTYATIFPAAPNLNLVYAVDTIEMRCDVMNQYGKTFDSKIEWSTSDESVVKFIDGTNKLVAVKGAEGKSAVVKAKLPNGKIAETIANVIKLKATGIKIFKLNGDELADISDTEYINVGGSMQILLVPSPVEISYQSDFKFSNDAFTLTKLKLNPETDEKKIEKTPKGGVWYLLSCHKEGNQTLNISIGNKPANKNDLSTFFETSQKFVVGSVVSKMGLNEGMNEYEATGVLDINKRDTITFFLDINPAGNDEVQKIFDSTQWTFEGFGALVLDKRFEITSSYVKFLVEIESGSVDGTLSVACNVQDKRARKTITITDFAAKPLNSISIEPSALDEELYVGETKNIRIKIDPMSSYPYLSKSFDIQFTTPDVVQLTNKGGTYTIKGLKQGSTDLVVSVRGMEARLHIETKAAVKSVLIDNNTSNVIMEGDVIDWFANVVMQGQDTPDYNRLLWSIINPKTDPIVTLSTPSKGKTITIKARNLSSGEMSAQATIQAEYRGRSNSRTITVVPLQKSQNIEDKDLGTEDDAYIEKLSGKIQISLGVNDSAKKAGKSLVTYIIEPKSTISGIDGTYNLSNSNIYVMWNDVSGLTKKVTSANIVIKNVGGNRYSVNGVTSIEVAGHVININANVSHLVK